MSDENVNEPQLPTPATGATGASPAVTRSGSLLSRFTRRQMLIALVGVAGAGVAAAVGVLGWYVAFRQPISQLPGLAIEVAPVYSYSVPGVQRPLGVAVDTENNRLYVTQSDGTRTVKVFDVEGNPLGELLPPDDGSAHSSTYVAVDPKTKNVFVTDRGSNQLYVYSPTGKYLNTVRPSTATSWGPLGITFDKQGLLYVGDANAGPQRIWVLKTDGTVVRSFGTGENMSFPNGIAVYDDGTVAVADSNHTQVLIYKADGTFQGKLAKGEADAALGIPRGLAVGAQDRLYVVDTTNAIVRVYRAGADGVPTYATMFGVIGQREGEFLYPNGVATDDHGHIYVTDRENNRVQVWTNP